MVFYAIFLVTNAMRIDSIGALCDEKGMKQKDFRHVRTSALFSAHIVY